ncbi:MAG: Gfo/Idh/MocA family oxidoreductase [Chloroflexi bacterium]|nr:Gfo/Idh/MocA family oxidoreductase [Chloroflexota bacterium]
MKVGVIGAGLQGARRATAIKQSGAASLVMIADMNLKAAGTIAEQLDCQPANDWREVIARQDIDSVVICTPTHLHAEMSIAAMEAGKHVLCEKPLARTIAEAAEMLKTSASRGVTLKCGFNYRYHPGIRQAKKWLDEGEIGELMLLRCRHGICGRPGYEKEWKTKPQLSGGGHMMEQGIHIVDLFRWFAGDFSQVTGHTATYFWNTPSEDNTFALLVTPKRQTAVLHSSLTEWRNLFSFEVFGKEGYVKVEGLGGSYGVEQAALGKRSFTAPFTEEVIEYRGADMSLQAEWQDFANAIEQQREPSGNGNDGLQALKLVHAIYESAASGLPVANVS